MVHNQHAVGLFLNGAGNALAMLRTRDKGFQDQEVQSALKMGTVFAIDSFSYRHSTQG